MRIAVDLGHGIGNDRGITGFIKEETIINEVGRILINKLKECGHKVIEVRPRFGIISLLQSLNHRTVTSNNNDAYLFLSIHGNKGGLRGVELYTNEGKEVEEAVNILENLEEIGFKNRGIKDGSNFYVIKYSVAEAILIKLCFVDNKEDIELYNKLGPHKVAQAIVNAIECKNANGEKKVMEIDI